MRLFLASTLLLLGCQVCQVCQVGCNKAAEPERAGSPSPPSAGGTPPASTGASSPAPAPRPTGPAEVAWDTPSGWSVAKARPMLKAAYTVPRAPGDPEDAELTVSQAGGTLEQNIARWAQQLDRKIPDVKRSERTVNGLKVTLVEIRGDYSGMSMPGGPPPAKKPGFALLGAIVETSPPTFFKLTGPEKTAAAAQRDFDKLIDSLRAK